MRINKILMMAVGAALSLSSCGFMHDDLPECAVRPDVRTRVEFVFDHNTALTDRFGEEVGSVTLYIFDHNGRYLREIERTNAVTGGALHADDFGIDLDLQPGKYMVYAVAQGNDAGYQASLRLPGAKFRRSLFSADKNDNVSGFRLSLDNNRGLVQHQNVMLDTIWTTLRASELLVPEVTEPKEGDPQQPDIEVKATIPLMRITNHLLFSFHQEEMPDRIDAAQYEVWIESAQGRDAMNIHGDFSDARARLRYEPFKTWVANDDNGHASIFCEFGISRVLYDPANRDRAMLYIKNKATGHVKSVDLLPLLAVGNQAFAQHKWSDQEFFDRHYDFRCHQAFDGDIPKYGIVYINLLSWSKRVQNEEL